MRYCTLLPLLAAFAIAGCSYHLSDHLPTITAFTDPAYVNRTFTRVAIVADTRDLEWRKELESQMAGSLAEWGIAVGAVESYRIIPPTREWSPAERQHAFAANGIDCYLSLAVDTSETEERYIPATLTTTTTRVRPGENVERETAVTKQRGGYAVRRASTRYRMTLTDRATGGTAWIALNDMGSDRGDRIRPFCEEVAAQLERDRLLRGE